MTARRLHVDQVAISLRGGWRERLFHQLSRELGDPALAEQAAEALAARVSAEVARAQGMETGRPSPPIEGRR